MPASPLPEPREAGRELDALIAERVFGIAVAHGVPCMYEHGSVPSDMGVAGSGGEAVFGRTYYDPIDHYSLRVGDAWQVIEAMRERGFDFRLRHFGTYTMEFLPRDLRHPGWSSDGYAAPLAICLAALAALTSETAAHV